MNGTDHLMPQPWLGRVVAEANALDAGYELHICSLAEHVQGAPTEGLPSWTGELRSGARANLLMGVASNRVDVKQAAAVAERALERLAEPLSALFLPAEQLARRAARRGLARGDPQQRPRLDLRLLGRRGVRRRAPPLRRGDADRRRPHRPRPRTRSAPRSPSTAAPRGRQPVGTARAAASWSSGCPAPTLPPGTQLVSSRPAEWVMLDDTAGRGRHRDGQRARVRAQRPVVHRRGARRHRADHTSGARRRARSSPRPSGASWPALRDGPRRRVGAGARDDEAGDDRAGPRRRRGRATAGRPGRAPRPPPTPVTVDELHLANGRVSVDVDPADGTFSIDGHAGLGRLVDGGDVGDTYNWCPPLAETLVDAPIAVTTRGRGGRARARSPRGACAPTSCPPTSRTRPGSGRSAVEVRTTLELHAGDDLVRVHVALDNHGLRDHRLRVHLPLPQRASSSRRGVRLRHRRARAHRRGRPHRAGAGHLPVAAVRHAPAASPSPTRGCSSTSWSTSTTPAPPPARWPSRCVRATGMLSQGPMATRPLPAGPMTPMEGPQSQHRVEARFAIHAGRPRPVRGGRRRLPPAARHPRRRERGHRSAGRARRCRSPAPR